MPYIICTNFLRKDLYCICFMIRNILRGTRLIFYNAHLKPPFQQWDFNTRHTFYTSQMTIEPSVGVENVFNQRDTSYWNSNFSTINPGRTLYVGLALRFKN